MITYYCACSLDNYIAGPNGELHWLPQPSDGRDYGYGAFYKRQDLVVMGRKTYEACLGFPEWPYQDKECVVLTRQEGLVAGFHGSFEPFDADAWRERSKDLHIYLNGGGGAAKLFLEHGLIDRLELTFVPVTLGDGIPLFAPGGPHTEWKLEMSHKVDDDLGLVQNIYFKA